MWGKEGDKCKCGGYTRVGTEGFGGAGWALMHGCVAIVGAHAHGEGTRICVWGHGVCVW